MGQREDIKEPPLRSYDFGHAWVGQEAAYTHEGGRPWLRLCVLGHEVKKGRWEEGEYVPYVSHAENTTQSPSHALSCFASPSSLLQIALDHPVRC
jgi:hypothetical protein